ncbi:hypothetical protein [Colwellia sp. BRX8-9]|uniref:hypothetical protein n=1 Tax=Colwellia sp. BRX8-9 TaxID=2759831 RepID=UPI0015F74244|nr:hypothetical protein [Colwellia sp. BRX8-9]MBA6349863.1 hypothetical protein [Colwellia sp. BRX8-9]
MSLISTAIAGVSFICMFMASPLEDVPLSHNSLLQSSISFIIKYAIILVWILVMAVGAIEFLLITAVLSDCEFNHSLISIIIITISFLLLPLLLYAFLIVKYNLTIMQDIAVIVFVSLIEPIIGVSIISIVFVLKFH